MSFSSYLVMTSLSQILSASGLYHGLGRGATSEPWLRGLSRGRPFKVKGNYGSSSLFEKLLSVGGEDRILGTGVNPSLGLGRDVVGPLLRGVRNGE